MFFFSLFFFLLSFSFQVYLSLRYLCCFLYNVYKHRGKNYSFLYGNNIIWFCTTIQTFLNYWYMIFRKLGGFFSFLFLCLRGNYSFSFVCCQVSHWWLNLSLLLVHNLQKLTFCFKSLGLLYLSQIDLFRHSVHPYKRKPYSFPLVSFSTYIGRFALLARPSLPLVHLKYLFCMLLGFSLLAKPFLTIGFFVKSVSVRQTFDELLYIHQEKRKLQFPFVILLGFILLARPFLTF